MYLRLAVTLVSLGATVILGYFTGLKPIAGYDPKDTTPMSVPGDIFEDSMVTNNIDMVTDMNDVTTDHTSQTASNSENLTSDIRINTHRQRTQLTIEFIYFILRLALSYVEKNTWIRNYIRPNGEIVISTQRSNDSNNQNNIFSIDHDEDFLKNLEVASLYFSTKVLIEFLGTKPGVFMVTGNETRSRLLVTKFKNELEGSIKEKTENILQQENIEYHRPKQIYTEDISKFINGYLCEPLKIIDNEYKDIFYNTSDSMEAIKTISNFEIPEEYKKYIENGDMKYKLSIRIPFINFSNRDTISNTLDFIKIPIIKDIISKIQIIEIKDLGYSEEDCEKLKTNLIGVKDIFSSTFIADPVILDLSNVIINFSELEEFIKSKPILNFHEYNFFRYLHFIPEANFKYEVTEFLNINGFNIPEILYDCIIPQIIQNPILLSSKDKTFVERSTYFSLLQYVKKPSNFISSFTREQVDVDEVCVEKMKIFKEKRIEVFKRLGKFGKWFENIEKMPQSVVLFENKIYNKLLN